MRKRSSLRNAQFKSWRHFLFAMLAALCAATSCGQDDGRASDDCYSVRKRNNSHFQMSPFPLPPKQMVVPRRQVWAIGWTFGILYCHEAGQFNVKSTKRTYQQNSV